MVEAADGVDDPVDRLARIGRAYVEVSRSSPGHCAVVFRHDLVDATDPGYQEWGDKAHGQLGDAVTAIRDQCNPDLDVDLAIAACWSAMQGLVDLYPNMSAVAEGHDQDLPELGDMAESFARLLARGLLAPDTETDDDNIDDA
jgi:hypothetical protein